MSPDRQILRLMAAMILAIIAYVAPSAAQAHEGHAHHGHRAAAAQPRAVAPVAASVPVTPAARSAAPAWSKVARATVAAARVEPTEDGCCRPGRETRCCGTMACCATGVLGGPPGLSPVLFGAVTLVPGDVAGRTGRGPEALPEPPRTRA